MANYREPQWLLPNEKNLQYPAAGATYGSGLSADRHSLYSMDFNSGNSDYINLGNPTALQFTSDLSISGWFKTSSTSAGRIISKDNVSNRSYTVQIQADGSVIGVIFESNSTAKVVTSSTGYNDGNWHHFGFTYEQGVGLKLYIDGGTPATLPYTSAPNFNQAANVEIGRRGDGFNYFNGQIDEISIFSRALSSDEIDTLYNNGSPSNPMLLSGKPVAYYPLGEQARKPGTANWRFPNEVLQGQAINFDGTDYIEIGDTTSLDDGDLSV